MHPSEAPIKRRLRHCMQEGSTLGFLSIAFFLYKQGSEVLIVNLIFYPGNFYFGLWFLGVESTVVGPTVWGPVAR